MDDARPALSEEMTLALAAGLLRKGVIDEADIETMCVGLSEDAAHQLRCCVVEAAAPSQSEWSAEQRRKRLRSIDGGKT